MEIPSGKTREIICRTVKEIELAEKQLCDQGYEKDGAFYQDEIEEEIRLLLEEHPDLQEIVLIPCYEWDNTVSTTKVMLFVKY